MTTITAEKLGILPCPFCGIPPYAAFGVRDIGGGDTRKVFIIQCQYSACGILARISTEGEAGYPQNTIRTNDEARELAISYWNQRTKND